MTLEIRNLSEDTMQLLKAEAERRHMEPESLAAEFVQLGLRLPPKIHDLSKFVGAWTEEDAREFESASVGFSKIDEEMWRDASPH